MHRRSIERSKNSSSSAPDCGTCGGLSTATRSFRSGDYAAGRAVDGVVRAGGRAPGVNADCRGVWWWVPREYRSNNGPSKGESAMGDDLERMSKDKDLERVSMEEIEA